MIRLRKARDAAEEPMRAKRGIAREQTIADRGDPESAGRVLEEAYLG